MNDNIQSFTGISSQTDINFTVYISIMFLRVVSSASRDTGWADTGVKNAVTWAQPGGKLS